MANTYPAPSSCICRVDVILNQAWKRSKSTHSWSNFTQSIVNSWASSTPVTRPAAIRERSRTAGCHTSTPELKSAMQSCTSVAAKNCCGMLQDALFTLFCRMFTVPTIRLFPAIMLWSPTSHGSPEYLPTVSRMISWILAVEHAHHNQGTHSNEPYRQILSQYHALMANLPSIPVTTCM